MRYLIIDSLNQFLRAFCVVPQMTPNGIPIGGCSGYLKILQKLSRDLKPDGIIICWDGEGGSLRRRGENKNYKEGRKSPKLNWDTSTFSEHELFNNKMWQMTHLMEYLNNLPVLQIMHAGLEADDVIAFVCNEMKADQKVIISSDKDFYQLLDDKTIIFRPTQNAFATAKTVLDDFGIHPNNFAISRAISGDSSDNLKGIAGAGLTTIAKRFPFLKEEKDATFETIFAACQNGKAGIKLFENILAEKDKIKENYKIMQLYSPSISPNVKDQIREALDNYPTDFNKTNFYKMAFQDGFSDISWESLFESLVKIQQKQRG